MTICSANVTQDMHSRNIQAARDPRFIQDRVEEYYRDRLAQKWQGRHPMKGLVPGKGAIRMRSNDYLALAGDSRIIAAEIDALKEGGHGDSVSRIWVHHEKDVYQAFEKRIARLMLAEDAVLCASGYCANVGLVQSLAKPNTPVYLDMKAHISLWEGVKSADAVARPFRHNDAEHLLRQITKFGPGIVIVDALYSTDGDLCPLHDIVAAVENTGCALIVDETHSFGTHGPDGGGLVAELGLEERVHFRTVGLSKAVASRGGVVVGSQRNMEFFRYEALPAIFSTSVLRHEIAGYQAVLDILKSDGWRRTRLHQNHSYLKQALQDLGYYVGGQTSQIIALEAGEIEKTVQLRDALERRGLFGSLFFPPATADNRCLIRFTVNCSLSDEDLQNAVRICRDIREEVGVAQWRSTIRNRKKIKMPIPAE